MKLKSLIQDRTEELSKICQLHKVKTLCAFGSSISNRFKEGKSDIDILIEIEENDPLKRGELLISIWDR